jgi:hypothetical protein
MKCSKCKFCDPREEKCEVAYVDSWTNIPCVAPTQLPSGAVCNKPDHVIYCGFPYCHSEVQDDFKITYIATDPNTNEEIKITLDFNEEKQFSDVTYPPKVEEKIPKEPPILWILFSEDWQYGDPIGMALKKSESWSYSEPPGLSLKFSESWSS